MIKRVFLIHGWEGNPDKEWFPWAKQQLEQLGYEVHAPQMPDTDNPQIDAWVSALVSEVGKPEQTDIFIGHSIGCQAIIRYLEALADGEKVEKVIFVAGWLTLSSESTPTDKEREIAKPWLENIIDFNQVKNKADSFACVFSDNDPYVPLDKNTQMFREKLGAQIIVEKNMGHFTLDDGVKKLPILLRFFS